MNVEVTEGMRHGDVYVLTQHEVNRLVNHHTSPLYAEIRALREAAPQPSPLERRRATYRNATAKRYDRYRALLRWYGEPSREPWTRHLAELDKRFKEQPPELPREGIAS